jgi:DHA1 family multidrug resistance protein-like MFS transporter
MNELAPESLNVTGATISHTLALMLASIFVVSMGYGVLLPVLPFLLQALPQNPYALSVSSNTGLLAGAYMGALFLLAPCWGALSDKWGRRVVLLTGLAGFSFSMFLYAISRDLILLYVATILAGGFAAGVLPIVMAWVSEHSSSEKRARAVAWLSASSALGFFFGPAIGGWLSVGGASSPVLLPFLTIALVSTLIWIMAYFYLPKSIPASIQPLVSTTAHPVALRKLLFMSWTTMFGIGAFEVGIALQGQGLLSLSPQELAWLFAECSLVMIVVQLLLVAPIVRCLGGHGVSLGFVVMALGVGLLPWASTYNHLLIGVGLIAGSAGLLIPGLALFTSLSAGDAQGAALGRQTSASSLGQAIGSGLAGGLFTMFSANFLWLPAIVLLGAALIAFRMTQEHGFATV